MKLPTAFAKFMALLLFWSASLAFGQNPLAEAARRITELNGKLVQQVKVAPSEVQQAVKLVPAVNPSDLHQVPSPQDPAKKITVVSDAQKQALMSLVDKFTAEKEQQQADYSSLALGFVIASAVLALLAAIFNFIRWTTVAGVISLVVIAVVGFPNVYPISALADFYGSLATQSIALQTDCQLKDPFTKEDYDAAAGELKTLLLYEASNRPKFASGKVSTEDLTKQLQTFKTAAAITSGSNM